MTAAPPDAVERRGSVLRHPGRIAAIVAGAEALLLVISIIFGLSGSWSSVLLNAAFFGIAFWIIGGIWIWQFLLQWKHFAGGWKWFVLVPFGLFRVVFTLIFVTIAIWTVSEALQHGMPPRH